jgi:hypothetical protein
VAGRAIPYGLRKGDACNCVAWPSRPCGPFTALRPVPRDFSDLLSNRGIAVSAMRTIHRLEALTTRYSRFAIESWHGRLGHENYSPV